jgi:hypothetical protein
VEYATREQAQQAVNTLSNQNLMGRLVYVREVCFNLSWLIYLNRIVKPNLDSRDPQRGVAADTMEDLVADLEADSVVEWVPALVVLARSMSPTFVSSPFIFLLDLCRVILLTLSR